MLFYTNKNICHIFVVKKSKSCPCHQDRGHLTPNRALACLIPPPPSHVLNFVFTIPLLFFLHLLFGNNFKVVRIVQRTPIHLYICLYFCIHLCISIHTHRIYIHSFENNLLSLLSFTIKYFCAIS